MKNILFAILLVLISNTAAANLYHIDDLDLSVEIPSGYISLTSNSPASDIETYTGLSKEFFQKELVRSHISLYLVNPSNRNYLLITYKEDKESTDIVDAKNASSKVSSAEYRKYFLGKLFSPQTSLDIIPDDMSIYENNDALYISVWGRYKAVPDFHMISYWTVKNKKHIYFLFVGPNNNKIEISTAARDFVNSVKYDPTPNSLTEKAFYRGLTKGLGAALAVLLFAISKYIWNKIKTRNSNN